ncbi:hypothetical protein BDW74DRAFT_172805 [Aspergillus multicolor]|uniref:uncharacterized protein n=1 Tax=Aspergillus multicolor TaxID=41759 RepID=UPI003CCE4BE5
MSGPRQPKRQRICRACDQCRRRKSKCDGEQPVCKICQAAGRTCSYENSGGRRGLPTGYVRGLEVTLGLLFQHIPDSQATLVKLLRDPQIDKHHALETWRKSKVASQISDLTNKCPRDSADDEGEPLPSHDDWEEPERGELPSNPQPVDAPALVDTLGFTLDAFQPVQPPSIIPAKPIHLLDLPLPQDTADLIEVYTIHIHSWFPIIERRDLLRTMYMYSADSHRSSSHLLLWAVIALAGFISGRNNETLPDPIDILSLIEREALAGAGRLSLGHIQAVIVLVLTKVGRGDVQTAWILSGQATRMLGVIQHSMQDQFIKTANGCALLDILISSVMDRAPSLSLEEHLGYEQVDEEGMEEWDSWILPRQCPPSQQRTSPKGPLRTLSAFNQLQRLAQIISRALYCPADIPTRRDILSEIQAARHTMENMYPYHGLDSATPPVLAVHLTGSFALLSALRRFGLKESRTTELTIATCDRMLNLLQDYTEISGTVRSSPLSTLFSLQCKHCLGNLDHSAESQNLMTINSRLAENLEWISSQGIYSSDSQTVGSIALFPGEGRDKTTAFAMPDISMLSPSDLPLQSTTMHSSAPEIASSAGRAPYATPASTAPENQPAPLTRSPLVGGTDGYDELFEELVTTIPNTKLEPAFATNLGFYAGDLDTDFLTQLHQPPGG